MGGLVPVRYRIYSEFMSIVMSSQFVLLADDRNSPTLRFPGAWRLMGVLLP